MSTPTVKDKQAVKAHNTRSASASSNQDKNMPLPKPIDEKEFKKLDTDRKLDKVAVALNKMASAMDIKMDNLSKQLDNKYDPMWKALFDEHEGAVPRVRELEKVVLEEETGVKDKVSALEQAATESIRIQDQLSAENKQLHRELDIMKGILQKQSDQMIFIKNDITYLAAKSMIKNLTISGLKEENNENPKNVVAQFLHEVLKTPLGEESDIRVAHRIGQPQEDRHRAMVVKCTLPLKSAIMESYKSYKEALNGQPCLYFVNEQYPDKIAEKRKEIRHFVWEQRRKEDHLPDNQKAKIKIQEDVVYVNKQPVNHKLGSVKIKDMFPTPEEQMELNSIKLAKSKDRTVKGSVFQAFAMEATEVEHARLAQQKVKVANPSATHIITAFLSGMDDYKFNDDGEYGSGLRLVRHLQGLGYTDKVVVVVRRFGGKHIGPQRFQIINDLAVEAIEGLSCEELLLLFSQKMNRNYFLDDLMKF